MINADKYMEQLKKEFAGASDRAAAIVAGAFLESLLEGLLKAFFIKDSATDKNIFEGNGSLSTFSAKIELSYRLGLISKDEARMTRFIKSIRNFFAHEL